MGLPVLFGANVDPVWHPPGSPLRLTRLTESLDLDFVTVQDHPYLPQFYDTWTLLAFLTGRTERITVVPTVTNLPLRPPAVLAKAAASLDLLSGGRLQLGLGTGFLWDGIEAMGGPRRSPREALQALEEAIDVIRAVWSGKEGAVISGRFYDLKGASGGPPPGTGLGIWVGAYGPRMLNLTGRKADGWIPSALHLPPAQAAEASREIDQAAESVGRDPGKIRKAYNVAGMIGSKSSEPFHGSPHQWVDQLLDIVDTVGMNAFAYWPDDDREYQIRRFAEEVVPEARRILSQH
jgi:alkanesulfonate monooxygenase SsuD/methylene tetrahydromethanopterin reductase-like flavin-dependent oxidoreductase (luciferase family)